MIRKAAALLFLVSMAHAVPAQPVKEQNPIATPDGAIIYNAQIPVIAIAALYVIPSTQSVNYTMLATDAVILASSTISSQTTITLPLASSNVGQLAKICKIDTSSTAVRINGQGADLIANSTGTIYLYARGSAVELISDGTTWWTTGKLPVGLAFIGYETDPVAAQANSATNTANFISVYVSDPIIVYGIEFVQGAGSGGNVDVGIYSSNSANNGPGLRLASSGSTANPGQSATHTINFTAQVDLLPGVYWLAMAWDNTTPTVTRYGTDSYIGIANQTSAFPLPATAAATLGTGRNWALAGRLRNGL